MFDGHNGAEASDMASKLLVDYFFLHTYFLLDVTYSMVLSKPEMLSSSVEPNGDFWELDLDTIWNNFDAERFAYLYVFPLGNSACFSEPLKVIVEHIILFLLILVHLL